MKSIRSITLEDVSFRYPETDVFSHISLSLPDGIVSLMGQNGTGKSTFLLLTAGNLLPDSGTVRIKGIDTKELRDEQERQRYISLVFQNMEFETAENIGDLLEFVYENSFITNKDDHLIPELIDVFELTDFLNKKTQEISKSELQRSILAFSLLYGSQILLMDEPIFAIEEYQKVRAMEYLTDYVRKNSLSLYYSVHELDISRKYSDFILLFSSKKAPVLGKTEELFTPKILEEAYEYPFVLLKNKEAVFRAMLNEQNTAYRG